MTQSYLSLGKSGNELKTYTQEINRMLRQSLSLYDYLGLGIGLDSLLGRVIKSYGDS